MFKGDIIGKFFRGQVRFREVTIISFIIGHLKADLFIYLKSKSGLIDQLSLNHVCYLFLVKKVAPKIKGFTMPLKCP